MRTRTCLLLVMLAVLVTPGCHIGGKPPEFADLPGLPKNAAGNRTVYVAVNPDDAKREELVRAFRSGLECSEQDAQNCADVLLSVGQTSLEGLPPDRARALVEALRVAGASARDYALFFYMLGEVNRPGPLPFLGETTLAQAIERAGGFTDVADRKRLEIRRREGSTERWSYDDITRVPTNAPLIFPGDTIEVKKRRFIW